MTFLLLPLSGWEEGEEEVTVVGGEARTCGVGWGTWGGGRVGGAPLWGGFAIGQGVSGFLLTCCEAMAVGHMGYRLQQGHQRVSQGDTGALPPSSWSPIRDPAVNFSQKAAPPPPSCSLDQIECWGN